MRETAAAGAEDGTGRAGVTWLPFWSGGRAGGAAIAAAAVLSAAQPPPIRHAERVDVTRILVDARVVDHAGHPVQDLGVDDFRVTIDGTPARIESVEWMAGAPDDGDDSRSHSGGRIEQAPANGRLIVFVVQKSLERGRIGGLLRTLFDAGPFLDSFTPRDRIAVLSFDSHLKIWLDFTGDLARVRQALQHDVVGRRPEAIQSPAPSLLARLPPSRAQRVYTMEEALGTLAAALDPLPGAKSVVLIGHGFGRASFSRDLSVATVMLDNYLETRRMLDAARVSVFCLDVTEADRHTLEAGLRTVAEDTGGFFERMFHFPALAFERLAGALAGHYVLFVERPELRRGRHRIRVDLTRRTGTVLARRELVM